ncbi:MAG: hypothetical protein WDO15_17995 [Bacteroidota bacterium]
MTTAFERVTINSLPVTQSITSTGGASVCKDVAANFISILPARDFNGIRTTLPLAPTAPTTPTVVWRMAT